MDVNVIQEYLVGLGFTIDQPTLKKFDQALKDSLKAVENTVAPEIKLFVELGLAAVAAYNAIGLATVGLMDHVAESELGFQLYAMKMYMSVDAAKKLKIATDALGYSLDEIAWNPELRQRYFGLVKDQATMQSGLGAQYLQEMKYLRDIRFEFTRLQVEGQYLGMALTKSLFEHLGISSDGLLQKIQHFNDYIIHNLPQIADKIATTLTPVLKDWVIIMRELGDIAKTTLGEFIQLIGDLTGDKSLQGTEVTFEKIGRALQWINYEVAATIQNFILLYKGLDDLGKAMLNFGKGGDFHTAEIKNALKELSLGVGLGTDAQYAATPEGRARVAIQMQRPTMDQAWMQSEAREGARQVSEKTGIPAEVIYGQWAHETGNFTNRGATDLNNFAGIKNPGGHGYHEFGSVADFVDYYTRLISDKRYVGAGTLQARNSNDFAAALKKGGYYEDSYQNYAKGIADWEGGYNQSSTANSTIHVGGVYVNVTNPNATPEEIQKATERAIEQKMGAQTQRNIAQLGGPYQ